MKKPWFCPPDFAFPIAWTYLYGTMGYASYIVFRDGGGLDGPARLPLLVYGSQLLLNWTFTPVYFGQKNLKGVKEKNIYYFSCKRSLFIAKIWCLLL